ncbi:MAG: hypothetical protein EOP30_09360 [Rhodococcus sp. (in: high G+C Gram-positive bacteria)]|nr:MAG: hypothetical protein EOP30_09360 [Rhodococcus sp. (in: high G+C Gram-positive bacteria)]
MLSIFEDGFELDAAEAACAGFATSDELLAETLIIWQRTAHGHVERILDKLDSPPASTLPPG